MARTIRRSTRQDEGTKQREIPDQATPFVGLFLAPLAALLFCWVVHYAIAGWDITVAGHRWRVPGSDGYMTLGTLMFGFAALGIGRIAWTMSEDRRPVWRQVLTGSTLFVGLWMPFLVGAGPNRWMATFFLICAWIVATTWSLPRLHVLRRDPREDGPSEDSEDNLMKTLGLTGFRHKGTPDIRYDESGEPERITVKINHRFGATRAPLQGALPNIESALGAPERLSRVTATDSGKSNESLMTVILKDPLLGRVPDPGPSHPGGSPSEWATVGKYDDGDWVQVSILGGVDPETGAKMPPTGFAFMGMSRSGKTVTENRLLLDQVITRCGTCLLYMNKAKGGQDVQPIIAGVEVAVISDSNVVYRKGLEELRNILTYRQKQLSRYGISAYSWEKCFENPPQRTLAGDPTPMEPMPWLIAFAGEADAIMVEAGDEATYIASKGLSVGIVPGWSMQRWSGDNMPTSLRFNIGTSFCFGCGDDYSAGFALSESTIKAGAHPEEWKARKPGRFFVETIGVPDNRFPVAAKGIGDVDDDALYTNMRLLAEKWGPRMDHLDRGSAIATRGWWDRGVAETNQLRIELTPPATSTDTPAPVPDDPTPTAARQENTPTMPPSAYRPPARPVTAPPIEVDDVDDPTDYAQEVARAEVQREIDEIDEIDGDRIDGDLIQPLDDDPEGESQLEQARAVSARAELDSPDPDDDVEITDDKPDAPGPVDAQLAFDQALRDALTVEQWRDPDDPADRSVIVRTGQLQKMYPFASRQWYSPMLRDMASGDRVCPPGIRVEKLAGDPRYTGDGWYRIRFDPNQ